METQRDEVFVPEAALEKRYEAWWVTTEDGREIRVRMIGPGPEGTSHVQSKELKAGDRLMAREMP